jgi:cobalt-zinc-cadmium efflux system membrane fusion protein
MLIKRILKGCIMILTLAFQECNRQEPHHAGQEDSLKNSSLSANRSMDTVQFNADTLRETTMYKSVTCSGTLVIPSSDIINIAPHAGGIVKTLFYPSGSYVQSGSCLAIIENIDFLKLQQDYLESKSQFSFFSEEYKRQGGLAIENASSLKKMQQAQLDFQTSEIRLRSLAKQLTLLGFITDSIDVDHLSGLISVNAPVSGYIGKISVRAGNGIEPGETILLMFRKFSPVLSLDIPEAEFRKLKIGQQLDFYLPGDSTVRYKARLSFIDRQIDQEKHMVKARAVPVDPSRQFVPGMQVTARLYYNVNTF